MAFATHAPVARILRTLTTRASPRRRQRPRQRTLRAVPRAGAPPVPAAAPPRASPVYDEEAAELMLTRCCKRVGALEKADVLRDLCRQLVDASASTNLTAVRDYAGALVVHASDSLSVLPPLDDALDVDAGANVVDIGAGAGFPGLPIAATRRRWRVVLLEATRKKVAFQRAAVDTCNLTNATPLWGRAEDVCRGPRRATFDAATARAVARLDVLAELALPLLRVGGVLVAQKSLDDQRSEVADAQGALKALGGRVEAVDEAFSQHILRDVADEYGLQLPKDDGRTKCIVVVRKTHNTPNLFPRSFNAIKREPL